MTLLGERKVASMLSIREMIPFVPAKDFAASKRFYGELFEIDWEDEKLCQVQAGSSKFLLQNYYQRDWAENSMYQLIVDNVDAIWERIQSTGVLQRHSNVRANPPKREAWGKVVYMWGPSGELWHFTERNAA